MEATGFDVEGGLESEALPSAGTSTTLLLPHTISALLEDDIPENHVQPLPAPAPAPAPEPRPVPPNNNNAGAAAGDELRERLRNFQSPYAPLPDEDVPVDDDDYLSTDEEEENVLSSTSAGPSSPSLDEDVPVDDDAYLTDEEEKVLASTSAGPSKRRRTGEAQQVHDQKLAGKAAVEESPEHPDPIEPLYTNEMLESTQSKQYVSTCSPPESTSTDGSEALDNITTPAVEPLFMVSSDSKAGGVGEKQAQGVGEEQARGVGEGHARGVGEER